MSNSKAEETLVGQVRMLGLPEPARHCRFHPDRKWEADFAWLDANLLVEIEGGVWVQGRHTRGSGFVKDIEKYNAAVMRGWHLLRFTPEQVESGEAVNMVEAALEQWFCGDAGSSGPWPIQALGEARASVALDHAADGRSVTQSEEDGDGQE